jgi:hypothetical protein
MTMSLSFLATPMMLKMLKLLTMKPLPLRVSGYCPSSNQLPQMLHSLFPAWIRQPLIRKYAHILHVGGHDRAKPCDHVAAERNTLHNGEAPWRLAAVLCRGAMPRH